MKNTKRFTLIVALAASMLLVSVTNPPYRIIRVDSVVRSIMADFGNNANHRPIVEWEEGRVKMWNVYPAVIRVYGIESAVDQTEIFAKIRARCLEERIVDVRLIFLSARDSVSVAPKVLNMYSIE